ncbi:MAG: glutaminase [Chlamydiales bacterium]|jgi:glutaminase
MTATSELFDIASKGTQGMICDCLSRGAELNAQNATGRTPLHVAAAYGHEFVVVELICAGSDLLRVDKEGKRAIDCAKTPSIQRKMILYARTITRPN